MDEEWHPCECCDEPKALHVIISTVDHFDKCPKRHYPPDALLLPRPSPPPPLTGVKSRSEVIGGPMNTRLAANHRIPVDVGGGRGCLFAMAAVLNPKHGGSGEQDLCAAMKPPSVGCTVRPNADSDSRSSADLWAPPVSRTRNAGLTDPEQGESDAERPRQLLQREGDSTGIRAACVVNVMQAECHRLFCLARV
ncbi:unnamed protein product [Arctogadus glacialis]